MHERESHLECSELRSNGKRRFSFALQGKFESLNRLAARDTLKLNNPIQGEGKKFFNEKLFLTITEKPFVKIIIFNPKDSSTSSPIILYDKSLETPPPAQRKGTSKSHRKSSERWAEKERRREYQEWSVVFARMMVHARITRRVCEAIRRLVTCHCHGYQPFVVVVTVVSPSGRWSCVRAAWTRKAGASSAHNYASAEDRTLIYG